jgi:hypothetical protein
MMAITSVKESTEDAGKCVLDLGEIMDGRIWVLKEVIVQLFVIG